MSLSRIIARLAELSAEQRGAAQSPATSTPYYIPGLWFDFVSTSARPIDPVTFYHDRLAHIAASDAQPLITGEAGGGWSKYAIIYNLFPRLTTAFDHAQDGHLQIGTGPEGWRETGTLLKCIALLPFIQSMGFNTIHLLPVTAVGQDGKKGNLGSPYGIRNPYRLDENLDEPVLGLDVNTLFAGFVEAAHRLGMRVVMEFVLRTSSKDGDIIAEHPEWFYWIRESIPDRAPGSRDPNAFGNPILPEETLHRLYAKVGANEYRDLPPPPESYRQMFTEPPRPEAVHMEAGRWIGVLEDGTRVRIPGAFSDWPPDDHQPPWGDVTYLRLYAHPKFNYMAYNTIRMYDELLAQPMYRNGPLWNYITGVIPYWQTNFGIDGIMIDMGHALPMPLKQQVIEAARTINPDFAFWDENFSISAQSRAEGYNAVMGYLMFDLHMWHKVREFIGKAAHHTAPILTFLPPENHNTLRAAARYGGVTYAQYAAVICMTLPGMPFVLTGLELGETQPINTGIGFSSEQMKQFPPEKLPLFSAAALGWSRSENLVATIRQAIAMRQSHQALFCDDRPASFTIGYCENPAILVFTRQGATGQVAIIANMDVQQPSSGRAVLSSRARVGRGVYGISGEVQLTDEFGVNVALSPGQVLAIALGD